MSESTPKRGGPNFALWVVAGIVLLMLGGIAVTIAISVSHGVADGYIPPEERGAEQPATARPRRAGSVSTR